MKKNNTQRDEGGNYSHVKDRLGQRVAPYDEGLPSQPPHRSGSRGDPRDRLRPPKDDRHGQRPVESSLFLPPPRGDGQPRDANR